MLMKPTLLLLVGSYLAAASASMVISAEQKLDTTVYTTDKCTSIIVAKGAGVEGPMTTHTADCADCDFRINKVPAMDWPKGSTRKLYQYRGSYPATVVSDRGKTWHPDNLEGTPQQIDQWKEMEKTMVTGVIPQVPHTYAMFEAGYGIMNEHHVAMGESTCASWLFASPTTDVDGGGKAHLEVRELSKIALERTKTAREAVQLMGDLATSMGFYSADWSGGDLSRGEGGESLQVVDTEEAWVFHVTSDDTGESAVWAAQRVPDGEVAVVANQFIIRGIDTKSDDFMYSKNIFEVATRAGLWSEKEDGPVLDFTRTFSPPRMHSKYATRRVWRVFTLINPELKLSPETDNWASDYPFSVKPLKPLTQKDMMDLQRDHYEGSEFDLTKGLAAGPYGDPERWDPAPQPGLPGMKDVLQGAFERAISLFRTSYSIVCVARGNMPEGFGAVVWFSQYAPHTSTYTPFYVQSTEAPESFTKGSLFKYDPTTAFWNFLACGNWASRFYKFATPTVKKVQDTLETQYIHESEQLEKSALEMLAKCEKAGNCEEKKVKEEVVEMLTKFTQAKGQLTTDTYRDLFPKLMTSFHDGYVAMNFDKPDIKMTKMFYPKWWLDAVGFFNNAPNDIDGAIMFNSDPHAQADARYATSAEYYAGMLCSGLFVGMVTLGAGFLAGKRDAAGSQHAYQTIDSQL